MAGLNWLNWVKLINSVGSSRATDKIWHMPHTQPQHWHYAIKIGRQNRGGHFRINFRIKIPMKLGSRHGLCVVQIISKWTDCLGTRLIWWGDDWDDCTKYLGISQWGRNFSVFSPLAFQSGTLPEFFWNDLVPSCLRLYAWAITCNWTKSKTQFSRIWRDHNFFLSLCETFATHSGMSQVTRSSSDETKITSGQNYKKPNLPGVSIF